MRGKYPFNSMRGTDASPLGISSVLYVHYNLHIQLHFICENSAANCIFFPVLFGLKSRLHFLLLKDRVYFHFSLELFSFCLYISDNEHHVWNHCICSLFSSSSSSKYCVANSYVRLIHVSP